MGLETLVYLSSAARGFGEDELADILASAERRNPAENLTGMLLYGEGSFAQVLEGPTDRLATMITRIRADPRHTGVIEIMRLPITERAFPDWAMGCRRISSTEPLPGEGGSGISERLAAAGPGDTLAFMRSFYTTAMREGTS